MKKFLNVYQKIKHLAFTKNKKDNNRPLLIEIDLGTDQSISPIKHKDLSILTTEINTITIISKFNCDCIYVKYSTQTELTQALKITKQFLYQLHWHWLCHAIVISINTDCLLTISLDKLHHIVDNIRGCLHLKHHIKPPAYIYAVNIASNYTQNCQLSTTALQDIRGQFVSSSTTISDLQNKFFNLKFTDKNYDQIHIIILLLADISAIMLKIQQLKSKISKYFNYRGIIFNPDYDLLSEAITKKVYRLSIIDKTINIKVSDFWLILIILVITIALTLTYYYNNKLIHKIQSHLTEKPSIKNLIEINKLSKDSLLSIPYIEWVLTREKIYNKAQHSLQAIVKNDIRHSLVEDKTNTNTNTNTNRLLQKEMKFSNRNHFFVSNTISNPLSMPFIFTTPGMHSYTQIHPDQHKLLLLQKKQLTKYLAGQYIRRHIYSLPSALFFLYKLNLLHGKYNTQTMNFTSMVNLYKQLSTNFNQSHRIFERSIISSAEKLLIRKIEWRINKNWSRHMTQSTKSQLKTLKEAGIKTNIDTLKVNLPKDQNKKIALTARRLTPQDKSAELILGTTALSFSHGPPTSVSLDINSLKKATCKVLFKKFNGQSSLIVINNHQDCIRGLISNHISNIKRGFVLISLSTGKEDLLLSIPSSGYARLLQAARPNHLPLHIKLIGVSHEI